MTMEQAYYIQLLDALRSGAQDKNTYAQANAKHILMSVDTPTAEYPRFNLKLADQADAQIYLYLEIGVNLYDSEREKAVLAFERGAQLIEYNHTDRVNQVSTSNYNLLVGAMGYYCAKQYSKSYILLKKMDEGTMMESLVKCLLTKNFGTLRENLNEVLLVNRSEVENYDESQTIILAESLSLLLLFIETGKKEGIERAEDGFLSIQRLAEIDNMPDLWWIARLMRIVAKTIQENSLWTCLNVLDIDNRLTSKYIRSLVYRPSHPIIELFPSQKAALDKVLTPQGAVVCLPTSSGKTRIAEMVILQTLINEEEAKILYIAPFRSLAYEIEESLSEVFRHLNISATHLYGGAVYTKMDQELIEESQLLIATPEKAKAILRGNKEIFESIKLVILDEGHLIGLEDRYLANEMFTEELRRTMKRNGGKFVLLSAVLPNPGDMAEWIAGSEENCVTNSWRASSQRVGLMTYEGHTVNINWESEPPGFNRHFVDGATSKYDATAKTAKKLSKLGSVMIFTAQARFVLSQGRALAVVEDDLVDWENSLEWQHFSLACEESGTTELFELAKKGIMCHSNLLPTNVRLAMETLLRKGKAKYIVATNTLAQGVNIGVSVVIFHSVDRGYKNPLPSRDFWNIAGRAGRAFVDSEGIILYLLDKTRGAWSYNSQLEQALQYLDSAQMENVRSGVGLLLHEIYRLAIEAGMKFEDLLEVLANGDLTGMNGGEEIARLSSLDDSLLSLVGDDSDEEIEVTLKHTLAYIQERSEAAKGTILKMLKARVRAVKAMSQGSEWEKSTALGIPLSDAIYLQQHIEEFRKIATDYIQGNESIDDVLKFVTEFEALLAEMPSGKFGYDGIAEQDFAEVQSRWLRGESITEFKKGMKYVNEYISFILPWAMNAVARELNNQDEEDEADVFMNIATFCESGLPNLSAVKIYKSGILSRSSSKNISEIEEEDFGNLSISTVASTIEEQKDALIMNENADELTREWVNYFYDKRNNSKDRLPILPRIEFTVGWSHLPDKMYCSRVGDNYYLHSADYRWMKKIDPTGELHFDQVADVPGVWFRNEGDNDWKMVNKNVWYRVRRR